MVLLRDFLYAICVTFLILKEKLQNSQVLSSLSGNFLKTPFQAGKNVIEEFIIMPFLG